MSQYLPPMVKGRQCQIDNYDLLIKTDQDGRKMYTYTVTWHEVDQVEESKSTDEVSLATPTPEFSFMKLSTTKTISPEKLKICKETVSNSTCRPEIPECCCDGPCGKIKPVTEMHVMGLCDHYICKDCFENAPAVETAGGFGCPNLRCYRTDLACLCTSRQHRQRKLHEILAMPLHKTTSASNMEKEKKDEMIERFKSMPCLYLVNVRLTTFTLLKNSHHICRQQQVIEMYDNYTMYQALNLLKQYAGIDSLDIAKCVYYCPSGRINERRAWIQVGKDDLLTPITRFGREERIDIIFDCAN
ncbi:unnamed protein product [Thelazia callipaeda]|uniref:RING-type domain-containing protein n=1 Tax=Thelazia callipaeda TaxID=103827 RepID=A0A0N5CWK1_THECL|nr:unnamed protein product [Thelazia callipaeda]